MLVKCAECGDDVRTQIRNGMTVIVCPNCGERNESQIGMVPEPVDELEPEPAVTIEEEVSLAGEAETEEEE